MSSDTSLQRALTGVDVAAEAARFRARFTTSIVSTRWPQPPADRNKKARKPTFKNSHVPSPFRPHVLAAERLTAWSTPVTTSFHNSLTQALPDSDARALLEVYNLLTILYFFLSQSYQVMLFSLDKSTRRVYGAGLLRFTQYCDSRNIPESDRMPASEALLSGFATVMAAGRVARTTLDNWLAGLHFWHTVNGAVWNGRDMLRTVKNGVTKLVPDSSKRAKRPPVTLEHMHALTAGLDLSNSFDTAVWAVACVAFWSCCRLGELLIPSHDTFDPLKHASGITPISIRVDTTTSSASFHIPWTKTTHRDGADIIITKLVDPSDAFTALLHHRKVNDNIPSNAPMFSYKTKDGGFAPMTRDWFLSRCEDVWLAAGLPKRAGHAFRIGGATELLLRGTAPDVVAVQGRWKSRAFLEYWRRIEGILPLFITNSFHAERAALVVHSMSSFSNQVATP